MAYDEQLAKRLNKIIEGRSDFYQQKMFGGIGFLLQGKMCFWIWNEFLILRLGEKQTAKAFKNKYTKPFDITGRVMKGWVMIKPEGMKTKTSLGRWVSQAIDFVSRLPRK